MLMAHLNRFLSIPNLEIRFQGNSLEFSKLREYRLSDFVKRHMIKSTLFLIVGVLMAGCTTERQSSKNDKAFSPGYCQPFQDDRLASFQVLPSDTSAAEMADNMPRGEQLIALQQKYAKATEPLELDVAIGLLYGQTGGFVNPSNAVVYFTKALQYALPERAYIEVVTWRGGSQEQLHNYDEALMDYLRGLLACSYYDLSGGWPNIQQSVVPIYSDSSDPENEQRIKDYNLYRQHLDFQQFLLMQRYYLIDGVKRVQREKSNRQIQEMLQKLTPDAGKYGTIMGWLKSANKRPWP
jgi:hypothetical protein